jgi:hypothetical protein
MPGWNERHLIDAPYFVYVLQNLKDGTYYVGSTRDLEARLIRHNLGRCFCKGSGSLGVDVLSSPAVCGKILLEGAAVVMTARR